MSDFVLPGYRRVPEPQLLFHDGKLDPHPLRGLLSNGPYSLRFGAPSQIRLALLAPSDHISKLEGLVSELGSKPIDTIELTRQIRFK